MNKQLFKSIYVLLFTNCILFTSCSSDEDNGEYQLLPDENEQYSGGRNGTSFNTSGEAFGFFSFSLTFEQQTDFGIGNSFFRQNWVTAPASATARDGLGPFYNAISCSSCHFKDGRGRPPMYNGELGTGLLLRLNLPQTDAHGGYLPETTYGNQLQDVAILGHDKEGEYTITYQYFYETYADGTQVELRKPDYSIVSLNYGALSGSVAISPRVANQMVGMGLLEAIPEATLLSYQDITDSNGDGISGKVNYVYDVVSQTTQMGRFGWKANQPNVKQQVAAAFSGDIGITSSIFPNENIPAGYDGSSIPNGGTPEITDETLEKVVLYSSALSVPARRNYQSQQVLKGKEIFNAIDCAKCHIPKMTTSNNYYIEAFRNQIIRPYTDLLLHDMGPELADNAPDYLADGNEWRTPPLWGIGLIPTVNNHTYLLHDGRARNVEEAILWHGGEATAAKNNFKNLSQTDRQKVLDFINSL
ncbi:di-heme oxidoredictase family protein [Flavobacterium sp. J27]|uniref:di-heme oxidoreductase family protein n=1 Tax=Flavobacterium sp. J27 TaxID=2060419 RepID=UPI00102FD388|nr:di-heme oxidoredictase family protein [Flavobacterium sp. J27]